jgi:hypothetical protein
MPKLLSQDQVEERVETVVAFVKMMMDKGRSVLNPSAPWMVVLAHS